MSTKENDIIEEILIDEMVEKTAEELYHELPSAYQRNIHFNAGKGGAEAEAELVNEIGIMWLRWKKEEMGI